ncbi:MAG: nucleoside transporter C-terminal domain-containing protein [Alphaproteobacteria bacterium]|nr:nucleoside transporter C-terminal domain-containing protein [Alphaproteobacteria bacterium]
MLRSIIGYFLFLIATLWLCEDKDIKLSRNWKPVIYGIIFQFGVMFLMTNLPAFISGIEYVARGFMRLKDATLEGTKFVFGYIGGGELPFDLTEGKMPFVFAFQVLPTVILVSGLSAILTYFKILPVLSKIIGSVFRFIFKIKDSIGMVAAAKIFVGQLEAPLLIKHKLQHLPKSDIFIILSLAFATTSCAVMPIYASVLDGICPNPMKHIIISTVLSVISVLIVCSIAMPEDKLEINYQDDKSEENPYNSFMGAMSKGLSDGAFVWWSIVGSLIGTIALITLANYLLALLPDYSGSPITLQRIFGFFMYPFAWLMGIESADLSAVSQILGTKMALNETIAFFDLAKANISQESVVKTIYAINNFGNFSCIGITVAGLTALAPNQKSIVTLAGKAFVAGFLASGLTATLISVFLSI